VAGSPAARIGSGYRQSFKFLRATKILRPARGTPHPDQVRAVKVTDLEPVADSDAATGEEISYWQWEHLLAAATRPNPPKTQPTTSVLVLGHAQTTCRRTAETVTIRP
jgi:hypothetical protein